MTAFERCYTPNPTAIETEYVFNITEWLDPHIENICGHSKPQCVKIVKDVTDGKTKLFYKHWSTDKVCIYYTVCSLKYKKAICQKWVLYTKE